MTTKNIGIAALLFSFLDKLWMLQGLLRWEGIINIYCCLPWIKRIQPLFVISAPFSMNGGSIVLTICSLIAHQCSITKCYRQKIFTWCSVAGKFRSICKLFALFGFAWSNQISDICKINLFRKILILLISIQSFGH